MGVCGAFIEGPGTREESGVGERVGVGGEGGGDGQRRTDLRVGPEWVPHRAPPTVPPSWEVFVVAMGAEGGRVARECGVRDVDESVCLEARKEKPDRP